MTSPASLRERMEGCLLGAAIGAELERACRLYPEPFRQVACLDDLRRLPLAPVDPGTDAQYRQQHPHAVFSRFPRLTPLVEAGVRAYVDAGGRAAPEDFARALCANREIADSNHTVWILLYTVQELLHEGCNPRISGMGVTLSGLLADAMPAVGIYHYADPAAAYLDGVELAAVGQPRLGADWAGLAAAAIAAALGPDAGPSGIVCAVLAQAQTHNEELYDELRHVVQAASGWRAGGDSDAWLRRWLSGYPCSQREASPLAPNPLRFVLPLLEPLDGDVPLLLALLLCPLPEQPPLGAPILAGAILGARHGREVFPTTWRQWAEPIARNWHPLLSLVESRCRAERAMIVVHERLQAPGAGTASLLEDKIFGCLLAGSIGNAMGSPVEGRSYREIDAEYPDGITTVLQPERLESEDDNQQMQLLLETYLARDGDPVMARHLARTWCDRWPRANLFPYIDRNAYQLIRAGWDPRITGQWNPMGTSVMCIEPVGLFHLADPDHAMIDARAIACMHVRGIELAATAILAAAVTEAMHPEATVDRVWEAALRAVGRDWPLSVPHQLATHDGRQHAGCRDYLATCLDVAQKYDDVFAAREELYARCLVCNWWQGAHLELVGLPLALLKIAGGDVRQAAIGGTNIGRDADTNAGRAAMLAGTLRGAGAVPAEWVALFNPAALERIRHNAAAMARVVAGGKLARLHRRQALIAPGASAAEMPHAEKVV